MKTNPFPVTAYLGPEYFCDRDVETEALISNVKNGLSTTLVAIRRMGKTGLVRHVFYKLPKSFIPVYLDILATKNQSEFLNALTSALTQAVPEETTIGKKIWKFIRTLRPVITYDPISGIPEVTFETSHPVVQANIQSVFVFLEKMGKPVVIAIDEFQQITEYPEKGMDAWLRTIIQTLTNVVFVFAGSRQQLMTQLFSDPKRPFYRSTQLLSFDNIPRKDYLDFIISLFRDHKKKVEPGLIDDVLSWARLHTYYVQLICNRMFSGSQRVVTRDVFIWEMNRLLKEQEPVFFQFRELLTKQQWELLVALGLEDVTRGPTSMKFIHKYKLGNPASVLRSLNALEDKEMVYHRMDEKGKKRYYVYDLLLNRWIQSKFRAG